MAFATTTYIPYEDNVLDILAEDQIKQAIFSPQLQVSALPVASVGTTTGGSSANLLIDAGATFSIAGVVAGDLVYNSSDGSYAIVKSVDSETQLTCTALVGGVDNMFQLGDGYAVKAAPSQQLVLTAIDGANKPGVYKRNLANTAWEVMDLKDKMNASVAPLLTDDAGAGYSVGSKWFDVVADRAYICLDATVGAAVWIEIAQESKRAVQMVVFDFASDVVFGDGKFYFHVDSRIGGMNLVDVHAEVITAGTTGTTDIQVHNLSRMADMLTTKLTIDSGETGSDTALTPAVIDIANDDVLENDLLRIDIDAVSTTAPKGLIITLGFQKP